LFERLVTAGYLVVIEGASMPKKTGKKRKSSSKKNVTASDDGTPLDSSTASSGSSISILTLTYAWDSALIEKASETVSVEEPVEDEQPSASSKKSKRGKRKAMQVEMVEPEGETLKELVNDVADNEEVSPTALAATSKFEMAMLPPVRNHRAPSVLVNPMETIRARKTIPVIPENDYEEDDSTEEITEEHLDDTIDVLQKYLQSLAPELRKKLNSADYSILMSSLVRMCQDMLGWSDKMVFDVGNLKTKSLSQLNKSIDWNVNLLTNQMTRMSQEKGIDTKRSIVKTLKEMKKTLEAPLLQERIELNPGEDIEWKVDSVINLDALDEEEEEVGRLVFTNYRCMYFGPHARSSDERGVEPDYSVPLGCISTISKLGDKKISSKTKRLEIVTKDQRTIRWGFKAGSHRRKEIFAWFKAYIASMPDNLFCFQVHSVLTHPSTLSSVLGGGDASLSSSSSSSSSSSPPPSTNGTATSVSPSSKTTTPSNASASVMDERKRMRGLNTADPGRPEFDGWSFYDPHTEFHRQGVSSDPKWTYTNANVDYQLCDTYPAAIWVPSAFPSDSLATAAGFRSKNRLPALAYYYGPNGATISRCSQPAVGVGRKRSKEDELLLAEIGGANTNTNRLPIFDARPKANAVANTAMGYGYELIQHYPNCSLTFCDIENIHVMRGSLSKLRDTIYKTSSSESAKFFTEVDDSGWLIHQTLVINSALRIVDLMHEQDTSVVIHCSDGWDRTAQLVSLSCLMLDPFYRTMNGFATLIEKDWLSFGHRFSLRHAFDGSSSSDRAPIFHQFLETVWQFVRQKPLIFEFNETFLITLLDEVYNAYYGTFIYDSQRERIEAGLPTKTISVWTALLSVSNRNKFTNPLYTPRNEVVLMSGSAQALAVWEQYFMRYQPRLTLPPSLDSLLALAAQRGSEKNGTALTNGSGNATSSATTQQQATSSSAVASSSVAPSSNPPRSALTNSAPNHKTQSSNRPTSVDSSPTTTTKKKAPYKRSRNTDPEK
jgi:hypothetical protein